MVSIKIGAQQISLTYASQIGSLDSEDNMKYIVGKKTLFNTYNILGNAYYIMKMIGFKSSNMDE